jgi:hypothetical protein
LGGACGAWNLALAWQGLDLLGGILSIWRELGGGRASVR